MDFPVKPTIKLLLGVLCTVVAVVFPLPFCQHDEYVGGTLQNPICTKCLMCGPGFGLNHWCNNHVRFPKETFECVPCRNGTFSGYNSTGMCDVCRPECSHNEVEIRQCSAINDRFCECRPGIFEHGAHGQCDQECCECVHGLGIVMKCRKDNIGGKLCAPPGISGKCPPLPTTPKTDSTKALSTRTGNHSKIPSQRITTEEMITARPSTKKITVQPAGSMVNINSTTPHSVISSTKEKSIYWVYACSVVSIILFVLVVYLIYRNHSNVCRRRQSQNEAIYALVEVPSPDNPNDTIPQNSSRAPLVPVTAPAVPTTARPSRN